MIGGADTAPAGVRPTIGDIRRARDMLMASGDLSAVSVAQALGAILGGSAADAALGLKASTGRRSALTVDRIATRDDLLRMMAKRHYADQSISAQARQVAAAADAYWRRAARLDRDLDHMPASYVGMPREFLFHIARLPATIPSERTIRLVLSDVEKSANWQSAGTFHCHAIRKALPQQTRGTKS